MSTLITTTVQGVQNIKYDASTTAMTISSGGIVAEPLKPTFRATVTSQTLSHGTWTLADANGTTYNRGNDYNTSTKKFIAPVAGAYFFYGRWFGSANAGRGSSAIYLNGTLVAQNLTPMSNINGGTQHSVEHIQNCSVNDEVQWYIYQESGGNVTTNGSSSLSHWGGFLIG